ncbi:hypothetical protein, partial [Parahaliea mediterranea]
LYGHSWVHNVPRTLLGQESPDNWKQVQESLNAKVRLYELIESNPIPINPGANGNHLNAIFNDTITKYWASSNQSSEVAEITFSVFMSCLEDGSITIAEQHLEQVT